MITSLLSQNRIHINNYANNITELKKTQRELERLSVVASTNRQGVHFMDRDYKINYANDALLRITGIHPRGGSWKDTHGAFPWSYTQASGSIRILVRVQKM